MHYDKKLSGPHRRLSNTKLSEQSGAALWRLTAFAAVCAVAVACTGAPLRPGDYHLAAQSRPAAAEPLTPGDPAIPAPVDAAAVPPRPRAGPKLETYSVVVSQVEVAELLFAMARDAKINVDIHPSVRGKVSLNAINQTLPQILSRLARQIDLRYEFDGKNLVVTPDMVFVRHYPVDYVNMTRESRSNTSIATQIASAGRDVVNSSGGSSAAMNNNSTTQILNTSSNRFWDTLLGNLRALIGEAGGAPGSGGAAASGAGASSGNSSGGAAVAGGASAPAGGGGAGVGASGGVTGSSSNPGAAPGTGGATSPSTNPAADGRAIETTAVFASPETGMITVRATNRIHERVREFLDKTMNSARRQVMIEATIAEVQLSEQFQQGVNWSRMKLDGTGWSLAQQPGGTAALGSGAVPGSGPGGITFSTTPGSTSLPGGANVAAQTPSIGVIRYLNSTSGLGNIGAAVSLLHSFGKVKVLSSPKISVLNNQTAVLKVVDNRVYFTIGVQITPGTATTAPLVTYTSTPNTVPVGFVMSVTPQIESAGNVSINVRPTISRIIGFVNDPNPALAQANVTSRIPEIQTREMESILKVSSGDIAVMGGLMQESVDNHSDGIPGASGLPILGNLFRYRNDASAKTELVIFIRPVVIKDASLEGDYRGVSGLQPGPDFFDKPDEPTVPRAWMHTKPTPSAPSAQGNSRSAP